MNISKITTPINTKFTWLLQLQIIYNVFVWSSSTVLHIQDGDRSHVEFFC